ncbi:MAG TPA: YbaB/EbfC family nucleoid-associated protein [Pseudonocardiaceae bacterium]|jgi:hypothetical protein|nr:YbaB/EbfC family nucleoid-associated protein [Pseudonocardiaceae bacterium]
MTADADWQRQLAENALRTQNLRDRVAGIRVTETSPHGVVRVTVSATGVVTDLVLTDRRHMPLAYVGTQIMECIRRAQARLPDLVRQAMLETVGVRDAGARLILDGVRQRGAAGQGALQDGVAALDWACDTMNQTAGTYEQQENQQAAVFTSTDQVLA